MDHDKTGCQPPPQGPILCINNCGFFGSAANMNMCSKCYKDMILNQEQAIENIVNESTKRNGKEPVEADIIDMQTDSLGVQSISLPSSQVPSSVDAGESKREEGPSRCHSCKKRVGLTGFNCRCGNTFCGSHRYSDKHNCPFDYRTAAQDAIAKANPLIRAEKLDKI